MPIEDKVEAQPAPPMPEAAETPENSKYLLGKVASWFKDRGERRGDLDMLRHTYVRQEA